MFVLKDTIVSYMNKSEYSNNLPFSHFGLRQIRLDVIFLDLISVQWTSLHLTLLHSATSPTT